MRLEIAARAQGMRRADRGRLRRLACAGAAASAAASRRIARCSRAGRRRKIKATWAPWTGPRLARGSGYGAGVVAPGWCAHLWETRDGAIASALWLAKVARVLRDAGISSRPPR